MDMTQAKSFVRNLSNTQAAMFLAWCVSDLLGMTIADLVEFTGRERRTVYNAMYEWESNGWVVSETKAHGRVTWFPVSESMFLKLIQDVKRTYGNNLPSSIEGRPVKLEIKTRYKKIPIPQELRWQIFERDNYTCQYCGSTEFLAADHILAESKGGQTVLENMQTLCKTCNSKKGAR